MTAIGAVMVILGLLLNTLTDPPLFQQRKFYWTILVVILFYVGGLLFIAGIAMWLWKAMP